VEEAEVNSLIVRTTVRALLPLLLLFSIFLFLRGHNQPGGGFVGGLMAAAAWALYAIAFGPATARRALYINPRILIGAGLLAILLSGMVGVLLGQPFLTAWWGDVYVPMLGRLEVGTPVLFDLGVYLTVVGVTVTMIFSLAEVAEE
jgi:multicomponent Na+:H+ antiporter subunit B